jgi:FkbM family methyltransferase
MRIKFNKEIEFLFKKTFLSEKYLLRKRLERAIKSNYEEELEILDKIVGKNFESIDVGVYRGVYSYKLSQISKHVHSFEPNPLIFPYLEKNLKKIIKNITLYNAALSNENKETELKIPLRNNTINNNYEEKYKLGCATIHKKNFSEKEKYITHKVKTLKLDDIYFNNKIDFIKIDVEGHEKSVIDGGIKLIKKYKPNLLVEIEERHSKEKVEDTISFINSLGYKSYILSKNNLISTNKLKNKILKNNYIFIP